MSPNKKIKVLANNFFFGNLFEMTDEEFQKEKEEAINRTEQYLNHSLKIAKLEDKEYFKNLKSELVILKTQFLCQK